MDEDENNNGQMQNDIGQVEDRIKQFGKNAVGKAGGTASDLINRQRNRNKKLKLAPNNTTKDGFVSPGKKLKGKKYQLQGKKKIAEGTAKKATGDATKMAGTTTRMTAKGVKAAGSAAQALDAVAPGVGSAIKASTEAAATAMDATGQTMEEIGKNVGKIGNEEIEAGKEQVKRGQTLEQTGKDIGDKKGAIPNKAIPAIPKIPAKPDMKTIVATAKKKALPKLIILGVVIAMVIFLTVVVLIIGSEVEEGSYNEGDNGNVPYVVTSNVLSQITIDVNSSGKWDFMCKDENGNYISLDQAIDNALEILKENDYALYEGLGSTDEERKEFLKLLVQAEIATQYPNIKGKGTSSSSTTAKGDYCIDTLEAASAKICTEQELINMVNNSNVSADGKNNLLSVIPDLVSYQENYHVNAVFVMAVARAASDCGVSWDLIDSSTYNWLSVEGEYKGASYTDVNGTQWRKYGSYSEAMKDFCELISSSDGSYFELNKHTVSSIAPTFSNYTWGDTVVQYMTEFYAGIGITESNSGLLESMSVAENIAKSDIEGNINIKRKDENGNITELQYIDENSFNQMLTAGSSDVMNYYTLRSQGSYTANGTPSSLSGSEAAEQIWNFLVGSGCTEQGAAALMGNLQAESGFRSVRVQGDYNYSNAEQYSADYTQKVDSGAISEYDFVNNGPGGGGYGLAQWTDPSRKQKLYTYAKSKGKSIGDLQTQLEFLVSELSTNSYFTPIWQLAISSTDMNKICDFVLDRFENPEVKDYTGRRGNATAIYNTYKGTKIPENTNSNGSTNNSSNNSTNSSSNSGTNNSNSNSSSNSSSESQNDNSSEESVISFDKFLFVGDSRYAGIQGQLVGLGSGAKVCAVSGSTPEHWLNTTSSGSGNVNGTSITLPEKSEVSGISVMLGVNATSQVAELEQVLQNLHNRYPDTTIYYNSAYHVASNYTVIDPATMNANIDAINQSIKELSNGFDWLKYVDVTENLYDENGFLKNADAEGIHLTGEGCTNLVNNIRLKVQGNGSENNSSSSGTSSSSAYGLVVASSTTQHIHTEDSFDEFLYSQIISTNSGTTGNGKRFSSTPPNEVVEDSEVTTYTSTCVDYSAATKEHTLYFDFLWAVFVETRDKDFVEDWATLALNSNIDITVYGVPNTTTSTTVTDAGTKIIVKKDNSTAYQDTYKRKRTTTMTTTGVVSKSAITKADTWLMEYTNDASTYAEYQAKSSEVLREKTEEDDDIIKLLRDDNDRLEKMGSGAYKVERMVQNNEKVSFMYEIYEYFIDKALNKETEYVSLTEIINTTSFDISTFSSIGRNGGASGDGSLGGQEIAQSGEGYNNIFKVGTRTYINYKQLNPNCSWLNESLAGFPNSKLGQSGCAINAIAVILSGYGINMTPKEVNDYAKSTSTPTCHDITLGTLLGKHVTNHTSGNITELILQQLNSGKPCMVWSNSYSSSHYFCILAISEDGTQVYVSDVGGDYEGQGRDGWQPVSILNRAKNVFTIDE